MKIHRNALSSAVIGTLALVALGACGNSTVSPADAALARIAKKCNVDVVDGQINATFDGLYDTNAITTNFCISATAGVAGDQILGSATAAQSTTFTINGLTYFSAYNGLDKSGSISVSKG